MTRYRRAPSTLWRAGLDAVVLRTADGARLTLDGAAGALWDAVVEWQTLDDLAASLASMFGAPPEVVRHDIADVVEELVRVGALEARP